MKFLHLYTLTLFCITASALCGEVRINEFMAANATGLTTKTGENDDWIEIHNPGDQAIDLEGSYLTDKVAFTADDPATFWQLPQINIEPGGYVVVFASGSGASSETEWHTNFKLSSQGERLALIAADGTSILSDFHPAFPPQQTNVSYGINNDGEATFMLHPTPGAKNRTGVSGFAAEVEFSVEHGFYQQPITLELTTTTPKAEIWYTLNDQEPDEGTLFTLPTGEIYSGPIEITKTTVVRAVAKKAGLQDSVLQTRTYLFLDDVIRQPKLPQGFPERWGSRPSDYEMDPEVVGDIYTAEQVKAALRAAPTISLVTENDNLFANDGIYTNSQAKDLVNDGIGDAWERPVSVELFGFPHGQSIQANAGIRMQGNASRSLNRVKHNMRLVFRKHYGPGKLHYRLFEDSEVDIFNSINLRSSNGDSWINPAVRVRAQYVRDQWHREVQRRMGLPNQSQIYAHLYINGLYWGLYHVFERFETSLLAEHFGGDEGDWDALQDTPAFQDIVVNGSDEAYRLTHELAQRDLTVQENYDALLKYVDVDNQIDYLLINFYSGNEDWDHKNMRYARRRTPVPGVPGNGWMYFAWDSERAGLNGLNNQSVTMDNTAKRTPLGPSLLNAEMHDNPDYHLRFADRVVKHLFNGGQLTPEGAAASWKALTDMVYEPLIGESARWGDLHVSRPETREGNWQTQLDKENTVWFPERTEVVLTQLAARGFIPRKPSFPQFEPFGGVVAPGMVVTMSIFNSTIFNPVTGDIHYTLNGTDPRKPDGTLNPTALRYDPAFPPVIEHTLTMMARVYDPDGDWSPLSETVFFLATPPNSDSLIISEIHYAPAPATAEEKATGYETSSFEFVELKNMSQEIIDISGIEFTNGISAVVADERQATLAPGASAVLVADLKAFAMRYPHVDLDDVVGEFAQETKLDNGGERITLRDRQGLLLHTLRYDDEKPWPAWEDDAGHSLTYLGGAGPSMGNPGNWFIGEEGGSPGAENEKATGSPGSELTLTSWLIAHGFTDPLGNVGINDSPALLFYAFGIDEFSTIVDRSPQLRRENGKIVITHKRRAGLTDIDWTVEFSHDLQAWKQAPAETTIIQAGDSVETVELAVSQEAAYWRLRVSIRFR